MNHPSMSIHSHFSIEFRSLVYVHQTGMKYVEYVSNDIIESANYTMVLNGYSDQSSITDATHLRQAEDSVD